MNHHKYEMKQIIPSDGWFIVYYDKEEKKYCKDRICGWALVFTPYDDDSFPPDSLCYSIKGISCCGGEMSTEGNGISSFIGYYHEKDDWDEFIDNNSVSDGNTPKIDK